MLSKDEAFKLTRFTHQDLQPSAAAIRDEAYGQRITYSPKISVPLTHLCRDSCSYCVFTQSPIEGVSPYIELEDIGKSCVSGIDALCSEILLTLGEFPEDKYEVARNWLHQNAYETTIDYLIEASRYALQNYGLLPHANSGAISAKNLVRLKKVAASQGMVLETIAGRLSEPGGPHFDCPDKSPALRLSTLEAAGRAKVPFSTGILVGIGETRQERIEALLAIRELHLRFNHIQEVLVINFTPKANTQMANYPACDVNEHLWAIAAARLIFQNSTHIQAPPNTTNSIDSLIHAGVDDLGGISPITPDYINPEKAWPHLSTMKIQLAEMGKDLMARASVYPEFIDKPGYIDDEVLPYIKAKVNSAGLLKNDPTNDFNGDEQIIDLTVEKNDVIEIKKRTRNLPVKHH